MKYPNSYLVNLTPNEILFHIKAGFKNINKKYLESNYDTTRPGCTAALTDSIITTCKDLKLRVFTEFPYQFPGELRENCYSNSAKGYVDFHIITAKGEKIYIELDSSIKPWSYNKLKYLVNLDLDYNCYWINWKRNNGGLNESNYFRRSKWNESDFNNDKVKFVKHIIDLTD